MASVGMPVHRWTLYIPRARCCHIPCPLNKYTCSCHPHLEGEQESSGCFYNDRVWLGTHSPCLQGHLERSLNHRGITVRWHWEQRRLKCVSDDWGTDGHLSQNIWVWGDLWVLALSMKLSQALYCPVVLYSEQCE